jgi:hypothetical protein
MIENIDLIKHGNPLWDPRNFLSANKARKIALKFYNPNLEEILNLIRDAANKGERSLCVNREFWEKHGELRDVEAENSVTLKALLDLEYDVYVDFDIPEDEEDVSDAPLRLVRVSW